jgi:hypothetical protein
VTNIITTLGSDISDFVVYTGDTQPATWGWVGLFLVVTAVVGSVGAIYYHVNNNGCFVDEVVTASAARWECADSASGAIPIVQEGYTEIFAEKLAELSPAALLFIISESKKVSSVLWANLKYFVADMVIIPESADESPSEREEQELPSELPSERNEQELSEQKDGTSTPTYGDRADGGEPSYYAPRHSKEDFANSLQEQVQQAFSIDKTESANVLLQTLADIETQKVFTITENLSLFVNHTLGCSQVMPYTLGLLTVGSVFKLSIGCFIVGSSILVGKLLYSLKKT